MILSQIIVDKLWKILHNYVEVVKNDVWCL
nr:MAG TPA: hypothetical protein [Caudoviricetes sp.]